ncbi:P-loop NTPase fold protein [Haloferula sp. BvORR071]|uniref:KAP family P-loop NTPase fold protein n=1 Tax=Haloferula sp. BvORR071 TaxID=1396141 RepID=UPI00069886C3|nr:P-loop NTPase fold protein [Haloferula sp. BvORR071]
MWADNETDEDLLGFSVHANLIGEIVTDPEMLPVTIGLFGDWGGGKSSILKILKRNFAEHPDFAVIYFNSWVFEGYEDAKSAILTSLLTELRDQRQWDKAVKDEIGSLLRRVRWMKVLKSVAAAGLAYVTANPLPLAAVENPIEPKDDTKGQSGPNDGAANPADYLKDVEEAVHNVRSFRRDFQSLIEKTGLKAFVILIDDLDRCSPERVIENLEAVKLFLNVESTAFVVAADRRIVENAIRIRYSSLFSGEQQFPAQQEALVTDYLEKLIQVPYTLPKLAPHEVRSYMSLLFLKKHLPDSTFDGLLVQYSEFLSRERYSSFPLDEPLQALPEGPQKSELIESVRLVEACSDAITDGLKGNPRQIKRFLNAYWLRRKFGNVAGLSHIKNHVLVKLMVLEYISSERFDDLYALHRLTPDGTVEVLRAIESATSPDELDEKLSSWRTSRIWKWAKSEPNLADEDLRDYFWLSRSSVSDTLSGVRLLSQAMRHCIDAMLSDSQPQSDRNAFFSSLSEDEQAGVVAMVGKKAMQDPDNQTPLDSLLGLALVGSELAATTFRSSALKIGAANLNAGLGVKLRNARPSSDTPAGKIVAQVILELGATETKIGRTISPKSPKR